MKELSDVNLAEKEARRLEVRISQTKAGMKRLVDLRSLQEGASIMVKCGLCEREILPSDKQLLGNNLKSKLTHVTLW